MDDTAQQPRRQCEERQEYVLGNGDCVEQREARHPPREDDQPLADLEPNQTLYRDTTATTGVVYDYHVQAYDAIPAERLAREVQRKALSGQPSRSDIWL